MAFNFNSDNNSFEQGNPLTQAAKTVTKAAASQTAAQVRATGQVVADQLTGDAHAAPEVDEAQVKQTQPAQSSNAPATHGSQHTGDATKAPDEQAKMDRIRRELFGNYASKFKTASNAQPGMVTTDLEQGMEKSRQERDQRDEQRRRDHEEEEQQRAQVEQEKRNEASTQAQGKSKGGGKMRMQPPQTEVDKAKTKTEINRGTTG